jgi:hypothetical protein
MWSTASTGSHGLFACGFSYFFILPWRWRRYVPPKRRLTPHLHDATSQKTAFFIVTAVETSNLTTISWTLTLDSTTTVQAMTRKFQHWKVPTIMLQTIIQEQQICLIFCGKKFNLRSECLLSWEGFSGFPQSTQQILALNPSKLSGYKAKYIEVYCILDNTVHPKVVFKHVHLGVFATLQSIYYFLYC